MKTVFNRELLEQILDLLGADLAAAGVREELLVIGGASLHLLGVIRRPTEDLDLIARKEGGRFVRVEAVPPAIDRSLQRIRRVIEVPEGFIDVRAADIMKLGLPEGYEGRVSSRDFGGLVLYLLDRGDIICLKVHAAADRGDPQGKHVQDLRSLAPTREELLVGARWAMTHDPSEGFRFVLCLALRELGVSDADERLPAGI